VAKAIRGQIISNQCAFRHSATIRLAGSDFDGGGECALILSKRAT